ncbi:M15 family metallopeptidase [Microbacterium sp. SLBN-146]|uniref:M15 family metallopeptidase n=1 Tax=Microbacterium sp. SLBN-146 TaxID=2768457 RepID=UPI001166BCFA|nr:M15 family metallopeptidase [Microbacterium sp. SLBN-146]TQJ30536.1 D-alanyl-D-alanine carboxypeptidase [Microbacterium sp. SLBN-146]
MPVPEPSALPPFRRARPAMHDVVVDGTSEPAAPVTRRALRQARDAETPMATPAIFRPPPPPLVYADPHPVPLIPGRERRRSPARHARVRRFARLAPVVAIAAASSLVLGSASIVTAAMAPAPAPIVAESPREVPTFDVTIQAPSTLMGPVLGPTAGSTGTVPAAGAVDDPCSLPAVTDALATGDEAAVIAAMDGPDGFRAKVATGLAPCVRLDDPARTWVVVDKLRPYTPVDYAPAELAAPASVPNVYGEVLRTDAAAALTALADGARAAGAGELGLGSGFRSYATQAANYEGHVATKGLEQADLVSARPGHSEHQSGLAADVVPCADVCGTIDDLAASPQGAWVAEHAWEYGWIVRYEEGATSETGFLPEPWHLRYVGPELARAYHEGGWHSLEAFFGLPEAPHYDG